MENLLNNTQYLKGEALRALHARAGLFVMPKPWDAGSAKMLASLGFEALATTSAGLAYGLGKPDGEGLITLDQNLANLQLIAEASPVPVSADMENGYADEPEACAKAIIMAAKSGAVGGSIEDATGRTQEPIYNFELSTERVKAAVKAARSLPFPFTLTARAENLIHDRPDLIDTINRLQAYADAGADVLFAPGLKTRAEIEMVVKAVAPHPVNVVISQAIAGITVHEFEDMGVKRISLGSALARAADGGFLAAAKEIAQNNSFTFANSGVTYGEINNMFR
jgi:2-methylisocitrate lyase-like PEP mutase family enzyme